VAVDLAGALSHVTSTPRRVALGQPQDVARNGDSVVAGGGARGSIK
jgi:hypothetical protein